MLSLLTMTIAIFMESRVIDSTYSFSDNTGRLVRDMTKLISTVLLSYANRQSNL